MSDRRIVAVIVAAILLAWCAITLAVLLLPPDLLWIVGLVIVAGALALFAILPWRPPPWMG